VRYHLELIPNALDLSTWRLSLEGNVERPLQLSFDALVKNFKQYRRGRQSVFRNSRSRFQPRSLVLSGVTGDGQRPLDRVP